MAKDQNSGNQESLEDDMDAALNAAAEELIVEGGDSLDEPIQSETDVQHEEPIDETSFEDEEVEDSQSEKQEQEEEILEKEEVVADQTQEAKTDDPDPAKETEPETQADKDYKELQGAYTRSQQALKDQEAKLAEIEQSIAQQKQEQQQAQLKPYHKESPEYQAFQPKKAQMDIVAQNIRGLATTLPGDENSDARDILTDKMSKQFSDADWQLWTESVQHDTQSKQAFFDNPAGAIGDVVDQRMKSAMDERQLTQEAEQNVNTVFSDPVLREAINADGGGNEIAVQMQKNIEGGISYQAAAQIAIKDHQILQLQAGKQKVSETKTRVSERQRLLRDDASLQEVNPVTASTDVEEKLKAKGVVPGSTNYDNRLLDSLLEEDGAWEESPTR